MKQITVILTLLISSFTLLPAETAPKPFPVISPADIKKSCCAKKEKAKKCDMKKCDMKDCDTKKCEKK